MSGHNSSRNRKQGHSSDNLGQSNDQEERMTIRRVRIENNRILKNKLIEQGGDNLQESSGEDGSKEIPRISQQQIQDSLLKIDEAKVLHTSQVSSIKLDVFKREGKRRGDEKIKTREFNTLLLGEQTNADSLRNELDSKWDSFNQIQNPYDLEKVILLVVGSPLMVIEQKKECQQIVDIKNKLVLDYTSELKLKDDDYIKEFKRQSDETGNSYNNHKLKDSLMKGMEEQYKSFKNVLNEELKKIETTFIKERSELLENVSKELDNLMQRRRDNESDYTDGKLNSMDKQQTDLDIIRTLDSEDYNKLKIKLETDIQVLEQQLAQMRGTYQLNMEKLEYNYQVLKKREEENAVILAAQKRRVTKLTDIMNLMKQKSIKQERIHDQEIQTLDQELKRMTELYEEFRKKYRHFQLADEMKYQELLKMQEDTLREIFRKILLSDKIIHEDHLKQVWITPDNHALRKLCGIQKEKFSEEFIEKEKEKRQSLQFKDQSNQKHNINNEIVDKKIETIKETELELDKYALKLGENNEIMKKAFDMITIEASFLIDEKLQDLLHHLPEEEQSLMKVDTIFRALNIKSVNEIHILTQLFIKKDEFGNETLVEIDDVVPIVKKFMDQRHDSLDESDKPTQTPKVHSKKIKSIEKNPDEYWEVLSQVIDDERINKWQRAYNNMEVYYSVLKERNKFMEQIDDVEKQNEELELLLSTYRNSNINKDLCIPPNSSSLIIQ